ncbi:hypothetical protein [Sulfurimonas sp.]
MKAISIDVVNQDVKEINIEMQPNTVYTFFSSILIDEIPTLRDHMIYTDGNAISENKIPFFMGEQLVVGDVLITGKTSLEDSDATIPLDELKSIISYDINQFYKDAFELLSQTDINLYIPFEVTQGEEKIQLNNEWVLYVFNLADDKTKEYFLNELKKSLETSDTVNYLKKMAQLAINSA